MQITLMSGKGKPFEIRSILMKNPELLAFMVQHVQHSLRLGVTDLLFVECSQGELVVTPAGFERLIAVWADDPSAGFYMWGPCDALNINVENGAPTLDVPIKASKALKSARTSNDPEESHVQTKILKSLREVGPWVDEGLAEAIKLCLDSLGEVGSTEMRTNIEKIKTNSALLKMHLSFLRELSEVWFDGHDLMFVMLLAFSNVSFEMMLVYGQRFHMAKTVNYLQTILDPPLYCYRMKCSIVDVGL